LIFQTNDIYTYEDTTNNVDNIIVECNESKAVKHQLMIEQINYRYDKLHYINYNKNIHVREPTFSFFYIYPDPYRFTYRHLVQEKKT
jgi:hypothetical protein